jgi:stage V sporulation protein B
MTALVPLAIAQLFTNAVMQSDITLLGRFLSAGAHLQSADAAVAAKSADEWVAVYRACQLFAFLPYQLLFSVTQVLFPFVARAHGAGDTESVRAYIARGARIGALACGLMIAVVAAMPGSLLGFAFTPEVAERGAVTLRVLALGQGAFAMLGLATTVLVSLGRERDAAIITLAALVCVVAGCFGVVPGRDFGEPQLLATACATSAALFVGVALGAARVVSLTRAFIPLATAGRVLLALGVAVALGTRVPRVGRLVVPFEAVAIAVVYLVVLVATRELTGQDAQLVRSLAGRKRAAA